MSEIVCKTCGKKCANLRGWKAHNSAAHGGYTEQDLADIAGTSSEQPDVKSRMSAFADMLPENGREQSKADAEYDDTPPIPDAPSIPSGKRIKATPKKLKKVIGSIPAKFFEAAHIELDSEDRDALEEAAEFLSEIFGVEFSVPESKYQVQSRWMAFLWVAGIMALIFFKHKSAAVFAAVKGTDKSEQEPSDTVN